jgi:DNA-binding transcriptional LysR family regulator
LTDAGRSLLDHARIVLQQVDTMRGELSAYSRGLKGSVRVLANTAALSEHLPRLLADFLAANPTIDLDLEDRESPAIAAAIAAERPGSIALFDIREAAAEGLATRLRRHYPEVPVRLATNHPAGYRLVVNATPLGMGAGDPLPFALDRVDPGALVGDVVLGAGTTTLLQEAARHGCRTLVGTDMLFEQIPAYLEFFGYGHATTDELRAVAKISYGDPAQKTDPASPPLG